MACLNASHTRFWLYVTHVDGEGPFLKISGLLDLASFLKIKGLLNTAQDTLEQSIGSVPQQAIAEGIICAAKYKDGNYYRVKIIDTSKLKFGLVGVHFIDVGNKDIISLSTLCLLDSYDRDLLQLPDQASDYYLAKSVHPLGRWEEPFLLQLKSWLCNAEHHITLESQIFTILVISLQFKGKDLSTYLVTNRFGIEIPLSRQVLLLHGEKPPSQSQTSSKPSTSKKSATYNSHILDINSYYQVLVSFVEDGPTSFAVQLITNVKTFYHLMHEINNRSYCCLSEPPPIGTACLGRISGSQVICRAIVVSLSKQKCQLFFIDFGDTEWVYCHDIYEIPEEFVKMNACAMRFCLSKVETLNKGTQLSETFKQIVNEKVLTLRVMPPEDSLLIQYGELYLGTDSVLDLLSANMKDKLQIKWMEMLPLGSRHSVQVSYVDSCINFFVQLSDQIDELNAVMDKVKSHCESSSSPGTLPVGAACCARFPNDNKWYRALVKDIRGNKALVAYVDYGNEEEVDISHLRTITPDLVNLPAQALKCALNSFENKPVDTEMSNKLEELALKNTFIAKVVGVLSNDTILISLVKCTINPHLDVAWIMKESSRLRVKPSSVIARAMMKSLMLRSNNEIKATTPNRKDEPDNFSSPEGTVADDSRKKGFRREKSFVGDRRSYQEGNDEFAKRSGSFRISDKDFNIKQDDLEYDNSNDVWGNRRDNRDEKQDNSGDKKESWNQILQYGGEGSDRPGSNATPRDNERAGRAPPAKKELSDPVPLDTPFTEFVIESGSQHEVFVNWIISPESFHVQILSQKPEFVEMMRKIPKLYKGVRSYTGPVPVGASVLARYSADGVLYRATVVSVLPLSKFVVSFVDYGNKQLVDAKDIWQIDRQLMELPKIAVHCSLIRVGPVDGEWKSNPEIDLCFNAPRYQCVFQELTKDKHKVSLWNNRVSVADMLIEKRLAVMSEQQSSVTLKDEITDEAIDLTIIQGQEILCRVTHVQSFEEFYVQLDLDKVASIETYIANFDANLLTPLGEDMLTDGIHCMVNHEGKIYRAVLQDAADATNITVLLADYGNVITTTLDKLTFLPAGLRMYYYQSYKCCFNNYRQESKALLSLNKLKEHLTGNKFIIYIDGVDEVGLVTTLYDKVSGEKIAVFEPDEGAYERVVPLCKRSVFNYNFGLAYISHVENLKEIYLQKSADGDKIAQLLDELFEFYEQGTPEPLTTLEVDELCAAKSSDGNWYRATILKVTRTEVKIRFLDYGNTETVSKNSPKKLDTKFYEPCALALVVGLGLVELEKYTLPKLLEWTNVKEVQIRLAFGADGWLASPLLDGVFETRQ